MTIPGDWLTCPTTMQEIEERLSEEGAPDLWLEQWREFLGHLGPRDELWEYFFIERSDPTSDDWQLSDVREGYALVRHGEVVDAISTASLC